MRSTNSLLPWITAALVLAAAACDSDDPTSGSEDGAADTGTDAGDAVPDEGEDPAADTDADVLLDPPEDTDADTDADVLLDPPEDAVADTAGEAAPDLVPDSGSGDLGELLGDGLWPPAEALEDPATLDLQSIRQWTEWVDLVRVALEEIRYTSWEVIEGEVRPVRIEGYIATPNHLTGGGADPAVVIAHGLGGNADADTAAETAARLNLVTLYYSGPGQGQSTGRGCTIPDALWDTIPDPRGSWFWGHAVAGSRAVTVLANRNGVDPGRIGMTGYSAGAMATINVNGFDTRLRATVPVSACGDLEPAARAGGWEVGLLAQDDLTVDSEEFQIWVDTIDPINQAPTQTAPVLLINGAQDEFFPIDSTVRTFEAFPGDESRIMVIVDWDHGWFATETPLYANYDNSEAAAEKIVGGQDFWFGHYPRGDSRFETVPSVPQSALLTDLALLVSLATEDAEYTVVEGHTYGSADGAYIFGGVALEDQDTHWQGVTALATADYGDHNLVYFTEFRFKSGAVGPEFVLTSVPHLPPAFTPVIRPLP